MENVEDNIQNIKISIKKKNFKCNICDYITDNKDNLNLHLQKHSETRTCDCIVL